MTPVEMDLERAHTPDSVVICSLVLDTGFSLRFQKKLQLGQITDIFWQVLRFLKQGKWVWEDHFEWTLRSDLLATWTWMSKSHQMWNLSGIISLSTISVPFSLSSPSGTPIMCRLLLWMLYHSSHRFFHNFFILFFFFLFQVPSRVTCSI